MAVTATRTADGAAEGRGEAKVARLMADNAAEGLPPESTLLHLFGPEEDDAAPAPERSSPPRPPEPTDGPRRLRKLLERGRGKEGPDPDEVARLMAELEGLGAKSDAEALEASFALGCGRLWMCDEGRALGLLASVAEAPPQSIAPADQITAILMLLPLLRKRELWARVVETAEKARTVAQGVWVDVSLPYIKGVALSTRGELREAAQCFKDAIQLDRACTPAFIELDSVLTHLNEQEQCRRFAQRLVDRGGHWVSCWQRPQHFLRGVVSTPWHEAAAFELARELERSFAAIQREVAELLAQECPWGKVGSADRGGESAVPHDRLLVERGEWREFVLLGDGVDCGSNRERCPTAASILAGFPAVAEAARLGLGESLLSRLQPGTRLKPHCGPTNMRLTCHLGIFVPPGTTITCGGEARTWEEGKCLVFDDSYEHEVTHAGASERIVLLVNFWHPALLPERWEALVSEARRPLVW